MGEIRTAQQNMEERCQRNMNMIVNTLKCRHEIAFTDDQIRSLIKVCQAQVKECVDINVINRRIRSCGQ